MSLNLIQGTPEWHSHRAQSVGSSDAPVIMGVSPWKTIEDLYKEKRGVIDSSPASFCMQRGINLEPKARSVFEEMTGIFVSPLVKVSKERVWMSASLDGIDFEEKNIVEIKCAGKKDHALAISGKIPEKYVPQLQHQMCVCDVDHAYYFSFDGENGVIIDVKRDEKYITSLISKEEEFWECLKQKKAPLSDTQLMNDQLWITASEELKNLQPLLKREKELREVLIGLSNGKKSTGNGLIVKKEIRKGIIDYSKIPELKDVDLELYRKDDIEIYKLYYS